MLVYGDQREVVKPRELMAAIAARLKSLRPMPAGIARHSKLAATLIEAGRLLQGVEDQGSSAADLRSFIHRLAGCMIRSHDSNYERLGDLPPVPAIVLPETAQLRLPEGFAFYAVYPEDYVEAARKLKLEGPPRVIGIRSIGTTLGPVVAAALGAEPAISVRPFGDPFAREVELPEGIIDEEAHYVVVDEGPGLSGSSFGSVADQLEKKGVPLDRIAFLCSHWGDLGHEASEDHRRRWQRAQRIAAQFDPTFLEREFGCLTSFAISTPWERCKYLAKLGDVPVLLKFAGLGSTGERKLEIARALHASGFTPEPLGLVHGFLIERWLGDARPLAANEKPVEEIGGYIGARARLLAGVQGTGASVDELVIMCRRNISLAFDERSAEVLDRWIPAELEQRILRTCTDNKLDKDEWLWSAGGRLIKCDALDHHQAHDLIGCQSLEWDVAGAIIEFALSPGETSLLIKAVGLPLNDGLLQFYLLAYAAFRLGRAELGGQADRARQYAGSLNHLVHQLSRPEEPAQMLV
jgi:hypothetical protein